MIKKILLIAPAIISDFGRAVPATGKKIRRGLMPPLHLATIAALTPSGFEVDIWDETLCGEIDAATVLDKTYDLACVTGYLSQIPRALMLAEEFRRRGTPTAIGGMGVSGSPEQCRKAFDIVFIGEAELIWPQFLKDWQQGVHRKEYCQVERPDLSVSPVPRWDSIAADIPRYEVAGVQTTRGCPFDCEFCDVIHLFGRRPRHKPVDRVIEEIVLLERLGASRIFFCDDNFVGNPKYTKQLLQKLIPVNNAFTTPLAYSTQASIELATDDELLSLLADCNFHLLHIGIESPREVNLKASNKTQNLRRDLAADCKKIQSYGIAVGALLMVGFDEDDADIFDEQARFIEDANILNSTLNVLKAFPGTPLWVRLQQEQRVVDVSDLSLRYPESTKLISNVIPSGMSHVELLEGYRTLLEKLCSWEDFRRRMNIFISSVKRRPRIPKPSLRQRAGKSIRLIKELISRRSSGIRVPREIRRAFIGIFLDTLKTAPHLLDRVIALTVLQTTEVLLYPYRCKVLQAQLDRIVSGNLKLDTDPTAGMIPANFEVEVRKAIPAVYAHLAADIKCRTDITGAMVNVFTDFLIRWGATFQQLEDTHTASLQELCSRHIERWKDSQASPVTQSDRAAVPELTAPDVQSLEFTQGLVVAVERQLRGEAKKMENIGV